MNTLKQLLLHELADIYDAEKQLVRALPRLQLAAVGERLKRMFGRHVGETERHVIKVEQIFQHFGVTAKAGSCAATAGLVEEAGQIVSEFQGSPALDAALICAAQKIEHHEIASYGCLLEWAELLGSTSAADVLQGILEEEKAVNDGLTQLARARCNQEACPEEDRSNGRDHADRANAAAGAAL